MKIVRIHHPYTVAQIVATPVVLTLGFFDGVHLGHQAVIKQAAAVARERQIPLAVMTFNQHPGLVFSQLDSEQMKYLTTPTMKAELMAALGVDILYIVEFTSALGALTPVEFVDQYIVGFHAQVAVAGFDYTFGPEKATMQDLVQYAQGRFDVVQVAKQEAAAAKISSTAIRAAIKAGNVDQANTLLGYPYRNAGVVVHGLARGRTIGFPTLNLAIDPAQHVPGIGIYAVKIALAGRWYLGMGSIGRNVTFGDKNAVTVELYVFDFDQMVYGEQVQVAWFTRLRGEIKFADAAGLVTQLQQDEQHSRAYFTNHSGQVSL
ncbi:riboflavin biosynthesis protein RibF [Loigolactobacillus jiayinensis]|uniref:Riboflavin biosynthesis protein n=1 Tax=Loigolactobacillus jiayinensis TaxID=2486016 RepID=A0ABW1RE57_9LACO|nr:riboflavin biosynthesis protein RibF [Loigolactobacillus jiayinensis]